MSELLSCPFCGGSKLYGTSNGIGSSYIECEDCGACGPNSEGEESDGELWNRRPDPAPVGVRLGPMKSNEANILRYGVDYIDGWNQYDEHLRLNEQQNPQPGAVVGDEISALASSVMNIAAAHERDGFDSDAECLRTAARLLRTLTNAGKGVASE